MLELIRQDTEKAPRAFFFIGKIEPQKLQAWLEQRRLTIPLDLREFWQTTGGGDLFETEEMLAPFTNANWQGDLDSMNKFHWSNGMPKDWLVFHIGLGGATAVSQSSSKYFNFREDKYEAIDTFNNLADWYENFLRKEYLSTYGLK